MEQPTPPMLATTRRRASRAPAARSGEEIVLHSVALAQPRVNHGQGAVEWVVLETPTRRRCLESRRDMLPPRESSRSSSANPPLRMQSCSSRAPPPMGRRDLHLHPPRDSPPGSTARSTAEPLSGRARRRCQACNTAPDTQLAALKLEPQDTHFAAAVDADDADAKHSPDALPWRRRATTDGQMRRATQRVGLSPTGKRSYAEAARRG